MLMLLSDGYDPNVRDDEWAPIELGETKLSVEARAAEQGGGGGGQEDDDDEDEDEEDDYYEEGGVSEEEAKMRKNKKEEAKKKAKSDDSGGGGGGGGGDGGGGGGGGGMLAYEHEKADDAYRAPTNTPLLLIALVETQSERVCELLLQFGALVDVVDSQGITPLIAAAALGLGALCQTLVDKLANMVLPKLLFKVLDPPYRVDKKPDVSGRSALLASCAALHPACTFALLQGGANPKFLDASGQTALHLACLGAADAQSHAARLVWGCDGDSRFNNIFLIHGSL
jgi:ankyrin repeat protein